MGGGGGRGGGGYLNTELEELRDVFRLPGTDLMQPGQHVPHIPDIDNQPFNHHQYRR
jgi:hypothetical protein